MLFSWSMRNNVEDVRDSFLSCTYFLGNIHPLWNPSPRFHNNKPRLRHISEHKQEELLMGYLSGSRILKSKETHNNIRVKDHKNLQRLHIICDQKEKVMIDVYNSLSLKPLHVFLPQDLL